MKRKKYVLDFFTLKYIKNFFYWSIVDLQCCVSLKYFFECNGLCFAPLSYLAQPASVVPLSSSFSGEQWMFQIKLGVNHCADKMNKYDVLGNRA